MTLSEAYNYGVYFLSCNGIDEAEFKSLCLVCHLDGIRNSEYELHKNDEVIMKRFADLLWRVKAGEPLQYVIGKWDFYESEFYVGEGVLIPRPETEELTELVIKQAKKLSNPVIYDLCSGSGCIGISIAKAVPSAKVYCVEKSEDAFSYLEKNASGVQNVSLIKADICFPDDIENFKIADIIVSNPPYIKTDVIKTLQQEVCEEPKMALDGGADGLDFYRVIAEKWSRYIKDGGYLFLEIGDEQGDDLKTILSDFEDVKVIKDMYGNDRMVMAKKKVKEYEFMSLFSYAREGGVYMALLVLVSRLFVVLFCTPVHECAHAWMANKLGDGTARVNGRLTLNPLAHFSPIGTIMILVFGIGYAKPVPVNPYNFKNAKKGFALTALAGPVSNFIMAFVAQFISIFLRYANSGGNKGLEAVSLFFFYAALVNVSLAVFNFLPIPPLDGSRIFGLILPDKVYDKFLQYERYIMIGLFALLFTGVLDGVISAITSFVMKVITFIPALIFSNIF